MDARCSRCHRPLRDPVHAAALLGPTCAAKLGLEFKKPVKARAPRAKKAKPGRRTQPVASPMLPFDLVGTTVDIIVGDEL